MSGHSRGRGSNVRSKDTTEDGCGHSRGAQTDHVFQRISSHRHSARVTPYPTTDALSAHDELTTTISTPGHSREAQTNHNIRATTRPRHHSVRATPHTNNDTLSSHDEPHETGAAASGPSTQTSNIDLFDTPTMSIYHQRKKRWEFSDSYLASSTIRCCFERRTIDFWPRISDIPPDTMDILFSDFKDQFMWPIGTDFVMVRRTWKRVAGHYYRDFVSMMKKGKKPQFLSTTILKKFEEYWKKPEVKKLSEINTRNRHKNVTLHKGGSKSYMQHRRDLRKELEREPTYMEVYLRVHRVEVEDDNGNVTYEWVDQRSSVFFDDYVRMKDELGDVEITSEQEDSIFHRLNKIHNKNYGFGNQPALSTSSSIMMDNEETTRVKRMLEQNEKIVKEMQEERKREKAEVVEQLRSGQEEVERLRHEQIEREERLRAEFEEQLHRERVKMNEMHEQMQAQIRAQSQMQSEMSRMMEAFVERHPSSQ